VDIQTDLSMDRALFGTIPRTDPAGIIGLPKRAFTQQAAELHAFLTSRGLAPA
jgi:hypothetical protein